jgi:hypothetical protein
MFTLPADLQVCRLPTPANHRLNSTNPRACLAAQAGVRGNTNRYGRVTLTSVLAPTPRFLPDICDEHNCREATSHPATCRCSCGGDGHGLAAQVDRAIGAINFQARRDVTGGFTGAMLRETDDCEAF